MARSAKIKEIAEVVEANQSHGLNLLIQRKQRMFEQIQYAYDLSKDISDPESEELFLMRTNEIDK